MTHTEKEARNQEIVRLRHDGKSMTEVSEMYGLTHGAVQKICKRYGVGGRMSDRKAVVQHPKNQYTAGDFDREGNAVRIIESKTPWFELAGNYTGVDGFADVKCKTCGNITCKSFVSIRHGKARCLICKRRELQAAREAAEQERLETLEKERAEKMRARFWNQNFRQVSMKVCQACGAVFTGSGRYCSARCRDSIKWKMKDAYRYLFPLEKVYERDGGICYLCGGRCDWNDYEERDGVIVYGNAYPSRDHVVPKSRGGKNTWDNIRLAHRICNTLKGNSPLVKKTV